MNDQNKNILLHLSLIYGVGPSTIIKILRGLFAQQFPDLLQADLMEVCSAQEQFNLEVLYTFSVNDFMKVCGLTEKVARDVAHGLGNGALLTQELDLINSHRVTLASLFDVAYPEILKQITYPPIVLYCKGAPLIPIAKRFSIVGSRKADAYANQVVRSVVPALVANGWHIVSGGAEGVDTMAHRATVDAEGRTLIVMGSGFLQPYPPSNSDFFTEVEQKGGTILSPFSLNTPPDKSTFPARNRIIAGLSQGCLVVRAAERSGALITAQFALDQGRLVFAVPGSIYDDLSVGCHGLIKQGAKLVNTAQDILEEFNEVASTTNFTPAVVAQHARQVSVAEALTLSDGADDFLLQFLGASCTIDELSDKTGLSLSELHDKLFTLQLEGKVRQNFAGQWERN
jgi:DNA processing protein